MLFGNVHCVLGMYLLFPIAHVVVEANTLFVVAGYLTDFPSEGHVTFITRTLEDRISNNLLVNQDSVMVIIFIVVLLTKVASFTRQSVL